MLFFVVSYSFPETKSSFFIDGKHYYPHINEMREEMLVHNEIFPPEYDVLARFLEEHYHYDVPSHRRFRRTETAYLDIKNDSLFIDSVLISLYQYVSPFELEVGERFDEHLEIPLSRLFPDTDGKAFARWFSAILRLKHYNEMCYDDNHSNDENVYHTEYIFDFEQGQVIRKGIARCACGKPKCEGDSNYVQMNEIFSDEGLMRRIDPCYEFIKDTSTLTMWALCSIVDIREKEAQEEMEERIKEERKRTLPGLYTLYKPYLDSLFRLAEEYIEKHDAPRQE
ncbi:MAG: hypothetical protein HUK20_02075 [Fibrobacter sp.]|nr:hypothetical protein [Fibrobacter sp.]